MQNQGLLVANEITNSRVRALGENLERCGVRHALITSENVQKLAAYWGAVFDRVLLDAPCSGEGMFRKSEEAVLQWSEYLVESCAARQDGLLRDAAQLVKPGGTLVYSTCTFAPEENERVIARFLGETPEFELLPLELPGASPGRPGWAANAAADLKHTARFWPHLSPGEGHFIAKLRRMSGSETRRKISVPTQLSYQAKDLWERFVREMFNLETFNDLVMPNAPLTLRGDQLYALPETLPELSGLRTLRSGVWLGTFKKNRFEPAHSLALALTQKELNSARTLDLDADSPELKRYLQGDVLEAPEQDGWLIVTVSGFALGWGRQSRGTVKNFYPKGLRRAP